MLGGAYLNNNRLAEAVNMYEEYSIARTQQSYCFK